MEKSLLPILGKAFHCHIYGVRPRRNVYLARTNRGLWIIKGYKQRDRAEWVTRLAHQLKEKGFFHTVQYLGNPLGEKVIQVGSRYYTVMKAIDGREADNGSLHDVKRSAATLARFHRAADGFSSSLSLVGNQPPILEKWEARLRDFRQIHNKIARRGAQNRLEQMILAMADGVEREAQYTIDKAYMMQLTSDLDQASIRGTLAHRDLASHNFMITPRGTCYLIDLDTVDNDMQLSDLVQFFGRMMLVQGYNLESFLQAMDSYASVNPLSEFQIWKIHQLLHYPDNILREVTGVYANRPGYRARNVVQLLQMERKLAAERKHFLQAEDQVMQHTAWGAHHYHYAG